MELLQLIIAAPNFVGGALRAAATASAPRTTNTEAPIAEIVMLHHRLSLPIALPPPSLPLLSQLLVSECVEGAAILSNEPYEGGELLVIHERTDSQSRLCSK